MGKHFDQNKYLHTFNDLPTLENMRQIVGNEEKDDKPMSRGELGMYHMYYHMLNTRGIIPPDMLDQHE